MMWKFRYRYQGPHVQVDVFVRKLNQHTYISCGHLIMNRAEWEDFNDRFIADSYNAHAEFRAEPVM